jgi:hypothetical protein
VAHSSGRVTSCERKSLCYIENGQVYSKAAEETSRSEGTRFTRIRFIVSRYNIIIIYCLKALNNVVGKLVIGIINTSALPARSRQILARSSL